MSRRPSLQSSRRRSPKAYLAEPLESRRLLTVINWTNRGITTGANDDRFDDVFGTLQNQARAVIDAAIAFWARTIVDFNYGGANPNSYNITISMNATAQGTGAGGVGANAGFNATINNKPSSGSAGIGWRSGITPTTNSAAGWYLDPTPFDSSEFQGTWQNAFVRQNTAGLGGGDLFTGILHELGHAMGIGANNQTRAVSTDTNTNDNTNAPASNPVSTLWSSNFNGALWTEYDSGGASGGAANFNGPQHFAPLGSSAVVNGTTRQGAVALMNAFFTSRSIISDVEADFLRIAFGYTIATPSGFGTTYGQLDADGTLRIDTTSLGTSNDVIDIRPVGGNLQLTINPSVRVATIDPLNPIVSNFPIGSVSRIQIDAGNGDDFVRIFSTAQAPPMTIFGGNGNDTLEAHGATNAYDNFITNSFSLAANGVNVTLHSGFNAMRFWTEGGDADFNLASVGTSTSTEILGSSNAETVTLHSLQAGAPMVMFMSSGSDTINVQTDGGVGLIASPVTINGSDGNDTVNVGPVAFAGTIVTSPITFNGDNDDDTLNLGSNNADSVAATVTFNGGAGINDRIIYNDQAPSYNIDYDVWPTFINRVGLSGQNVLYSSVDRITINGGAGSDSVVVRNGVAPIVEAFGNEGNDFFTRGDGIITASSVANFNGGNGVDQITFDDHLNTQNIIFDCRPGEVIYGGLITQLTTGFESVGILAGSGQNEITFVQTLAQNFNVDAGPGNDTIIIGFNGTVNFQGNVSVNGGDGSDTFNINAANTSGAANVSFNGGNNLNVLNINRPGTLLYDLSNSFANLYSFGSQGLFGLANMETTFVTGNSLGETFNLYGNSSVLGSYQVSGNDGNDIFNALATDTNAFDNLLLFGGGGTNTFVFDASGTTIGKSYIMGNGYLTRPSGILNDDLFFGSSMQNVSVYGGAGDDSFAVNQFSLGSNLAFFGGGGNDALSLGNGNLQATLTNAASFTWNGGADTDTLTIRNANNTNGWTYTVNAANLTSQTNFPASAYTWVASNSNVESISIEAGTVQDVLRLNSVSNNQAVTFFGNEGNDALNWLSNPQQITGVVQFFGQGGDDFITNIFNPDTVARVVHLTQTSFGATAGDDYFGPGGGVVFDDLATFSINMGSGDDIVYAQPNAVALVSLNGGAGTDTLFLAMAAAGAYTVDPGSFGFTDVNSALAAKLSYINFESGPAFDDIAPTALGVTFVWDDIDQHLDFVFDEDVSASFNASLVTITNTLTNEVIAVGDMLASYDLGTQTGSIRFPNFAYGALPDGNYSVALSSGYADTFGNVGTAPLTADVFSLAGDANHDGSVNFDDLLVVAQNYGQTGLSFSQGNFNYSADGLVDFDDLLILAQRYGTSVLTAPLASAPTRKVRATRQTIVT